MDNYTILAHRLRTLSALLVQSLELLSESKNPHADAVAAQNVQAWQEDVQKHSAELHALLTEIERMIE